MNTGFGIGTVGQKGHCTTCKCSLKRCEVKVGINPRFTAGAGNFNVAASRCGTADTRPKTAGSKKHRKFACKGNVDALPNCG